MKRLNGNRMRLMGVGLVVGILFSGGRAKADFIFGEPTNLGPTVNTTSGWQGEPSVSADGLSLYFISDRSGGLGDSDIWVTTRPTKDDDSWGPPVNLGSPVNSSAEEKGPSISTDGLELYFVTRRSGEWEINVSTRPTRDDHWSTPVALQVIPWGTVDSATISANGLELYFSLYRSNDGWYDVYMMRRASTNGPWGGAARLGPNVNGGVNDLAPSISADGLILFYWSGGKLCVARRGTCTETWRPHVSLSSLNFSTLGSYWDYGPSISADGSTLYFESDRPGSFGSTDLWQVPINPVVEFTGDGQIDIKDLIVLIEHWGQNVPSLDVGPVAWGDGVIDTADLEVLMRYWGQKVYDPHFIAHWTLDETEGDVAYDSIGEQDAAVLGDPVWLPGQGVIDGALQFDGIDDYIYTPYVFNPGISAFSVFAWIKGGAPGQVIFSQKEGTDWLLTDAQGCIMTALIGEARGRGEPLLSGTIVTDGDWHRVGLVWDRSYRSLYVDDELAATDAGPQNNIPSRIAAQYIGAAANRDFGAFWSGLIDDVRIYDWAVDP